jgi:hypothetical protein
MVDFAVCRVRNHSGADPRLNAGLVCGGTFTEGFQGTRGSASLPDWKAPLDGLRSKNAFHAGLHGCPRSKLAQHARPARPDLWRPSPFFILHSSFLLLTSYFPASAGPRHSLLTGTTIRLRRDIHRGIPGNARQRVPTRLESAVGWASLEKRIPCWHCMMPSLDNSLSTRDSASGPVAPFPILHSSFFFLLLRIRGSPTFAVEPVQGYVCGGTFTEGFQGTRGSASLPDWKAPLDGLR